VIVLTNARLHCDVVIGKKESEWGGGWEDSSAYSKAKANLGGCPRGNMLEGLLVDVYGLVLTAIGEHWPLDCHFDADSMGNCRLVTVGQVGKLRVATPWIPRPRAGARNSA